MRGSASGAKGWKNFKGMKNPFVKALARRGGLW